MVNREGVVESHSKARKFSQVDFLIHEVGYCHVEEQLLLYSQFLVIFWSPNNLILNSEHVFIGATLFSSVVSKHLLFRLLIGALLENS